MYFIFSEHRAYTHKHIFRIQVFYFSTIIKNKLFMINVKLLYIKSLKFAFNKISHVLFM